MVYQNILDLKAKDGLELFLRAAKKCDPSLDIERLQRVALASVKYLQSGKDERGELADTRELEKRWYSSLISDEGPDWSVYSDPLYLAELWACWIKYSRRYMQMIANNPLTKDSEQTATAAIIERLGRSPRVIVDLGCGAGWTTAVWKQLFPNARVIGTNLGGTTQFKMAQELARVVPFEMVADIEDINEKADIVFASEFFEHIAAPVDYLEQVMMTLDPTVLIFANTFTSPSIGHFPQYEVDGEMKSGRETTKAFMAMLDSFNHERIKSAFWNNRPRISIRKRPAVPAIIDSNRVQTMPRYPIYVPSKGRVDKCFTAEFLVRDNVPFRLVVEKEEVDKYAARFGMDRILVLPESGQGLIFARNWIKQHSIDEGHERHWQLDDNSRGMIRWFRGQRLWIEAGVALAIVEDFTDRYKNIAISGCNYDAFGIGRQPAFHLNCRVYSCTLVNNAIPHRWRIAYNDDTDICLQVLADGWCTVLVNAILFKKIRTMTIGGGNTKDLYQGDGRLRMSRALERIWPGVAYTHRRFGRPQHKIKHTWRKFDTPLQFKDGTSLEDYQYVNEYGLRIVEKEPIQSSELRAFVEQYNADVIASEES